jgi:hypothetical protein
MPAGYHHPDTPLNDQDDENIDTSSTHDADDSHEQESFHYDDDLEEGNALMGDEDDVDYYHRRRRKMKVILAAAVVLVLVIISTVVGVVVSSNKKSTAPPEEPSPTESPTWDDTKNTANQNETSTKNDTTSDLTWPGPPKAPDDLYSNCVSSETKDLLSCQNSCTVAKCCFSPGAENCFTQFIEICPEYDICAHTDFSNLGDNYPEAYVEAKPVTSTGGAYYTVPEDFELAEPALVEKPPVAGFDTMDSSSGLLEGINGGGGAKSIDIEKVCSKDNFKSTTGKQQCTDACMARECCFGSEDSNCASLYPPRYCNGYDVACLILKVSVENTTAAPGEVENEDYTLQTTKTVAIAGMAQISPADAYCTEAQMNTKEERDKCEKACEPRACCFTDGPDNCAAAFPQDCAEYINCNNLIAKLKQLQQEEAAGAAFTSLTPEEQVLNATAETKKQADYYSSMTGGNAATNNTSVSTACSEENLSRGDDGKAECLAFCNLQSCCFSTDEAINCEDEHADWCAGYEVCKAVAVESSSSVSEPPTDDSVIQSSTDLMTACSSDKTITVEGALACSSACSLKSCCADKSCRGGQRDCVGYELCRNQDTFATAVGLSQPMDTTAATTSSSTTMSPTAAPVYVATNAPTTAAIQPPPDILSICDSSQLTTVDGYNACEVACAPAKCCNDDTAADCDLRVCRSFAICQDFWSAISPADVPPDILGGALGQMEGEPAQAQP